MHIVVGPTNEYPEGKLNDEDAGALTMAIGIEKKKVVIRFGTPISWVGMGATQAKEFARMISEKAEEIERRES